MPLPEGNAAACVKDHVAQYVHHPSREFYFKVKNPTKNLRRQQKGLKRPFSRISTDTFCTAETKEVVTTAVARKTFRLYEEEIASACSENAAASEIFRRTAALECRHLHMDATDVFDPEHEISPSADQLTLAEFLLSPLLPWGGSVAVHLVTLDLEQNALGDLGVERLCAHVLPHTKSLQRLLLASNQIHGGGLAHLCAFLLRLSESGERVLPHLATLGLTNNDLLDVSAEKKLELTASVPFSAGKWLGEVLLLYRRTARRVHLNHVGFKTQDVVDLLVSLSLPDATATVSSVFPCFETIYLKQNDAIDIGELEECIGKLSPPDNYKSFLAKHVLL